MPSFIAIYRDVEADCLCPLVSLVEGLFDRPIIGDITIRNVALVPRSGHVYVHVDAPSAASVSELFAGNFLYRTHVMETDGVHWSRLIGLAEASDFSEKPEPFDLADTPMELSVS